METYGAIAYTHNSQDPRWRLENVPDRFALRLDLNYATGKKVVLIYDETPSQDEQQKLMWQLQTAAAKHRFTLTRTDRGGTPIEVPPIGA